MEFDFDILIGKTGKNKTTNLEKESDLPKIFRIENHRQARLARVLRKREIISTGNRRINL